MCDELGFKLRRRHIADRGMKAFLVINLLEEYSDCGPCLVEVKIKVLILGECIVRDFENVDFMSPSKWIMPASSSLRN